MSSRYEVIVSPIISSIKIYDKEKDQSIEGRTRYTTSMLITDLSMGECRIHLVAGKLNHEINTMVYDKIKELGYERAQLEVPEGTPASHLAEFKFNKDGLDRYTKEL